MRPALAIRVRELWPEYDILLSSTTDTGLELGRRLFERDRVVRFPVDLSFVVRRFLRRIQPDFVVLVELEIWPNFLRECNRRGVPVAVVNGRITDKSHARYLVFRKLLPQFNRISLFCVQSEEYAQRFQRLGVAGERLLVTGNLKADALPQATVEPGSEWRRWMPPEEGRLVLVAGSTHDPEESIVVEGLARGLCPTRG